MILEALLRAVAEFAGAAIGKTLCSSAPTPAATTAAFRHPTKATALVSGLLAYQPNEAAGSQVKYGARATKRERQVFKPVMHHDHHKFAIGLRISVLNGAPAKLKVKCSISKTITDEIESQVDDPEQMKLL